MIIVSDSLLHHSGGGCLSWQRKVHLTRLGRSIVTMVKRRPNIDHVVTYPVTYTSLLDAMITVAHHVRPLPVASPRPLQVLSEHVY